MVLKGFLYVLSLLSILFRIVERITRILLVCGGQQKRLLAQVQNEFLLQRYSCSGV